MEEFRFAIVTSPVHAKNLAEIGNRDMLADIQAQNSPQNTDSKQPEIHGDASDQPERCRHSQSKRGFFHNEDYGQPTVAGKGSSIRSASFSP